MAHSVTTYPVENDDGCLLHDDQASDNLVLFYISGSPSEHS